MEFVRFEDKDGNPRGVAVFRVLGRELITLDQLGLEAKIARMTTLNPNYKPSVEMAALAEMKDAEQA